MAMAPAWRKSVLTAHIVSSVGWLGAVAAFLALATAGLTSTDAALVRGVYVSMDVITWYLIVPASFAAFVTGVAGSLVTPWRLFRHYWVLIKLLITVAATALLMLHTRPIAYMAQAAAGAPLAPRELHAVRLQLVVDAGAALGALLVTTVLGVYKPRGTTPYGTRKRTDTAPAT
jgi:uncharacterized membrane protein